eukprot:COSAG01_NODE_476_length_16515_cov_37.730690_8_plen_261_part_00
MMDADGVRPDGHTYIELLAAWYVRRHTAPRPHGSAPLSTDTSPPPRAFHRHEPTMRSTGRKPPPVQLTETPHRDRCARRSALARGGGQPEQVRARPAAADDDDGGILGRRARGARPHSAPLSPAAGWWVRVEIMGAGTSDKAEESRPVLVTIDPVIFTRSRAPQGELLLARMRSTGVARGLRVYHWLLQAYARRAPAEGAAAAPRGGGGGEEAAFACVAPAAPRRSPAHPPQLIQRLDDSAAARCCRLQIRRTSGHLSTF